MTHDELPAEVNKLYDLGCNYELYKALRAVIELHKAETESPKCSVCQEGYPYSIIQALEKELR